MRKYLIIISLLLCLSFAVDRKWENFLKNNLFRECKSRGPVLPLSYYVPPNYYSNIPSDKRISPESTAKSQFVDVCNKVVDIAQMRDYEFQTERVITSYGLNIYDGAIWMIANAYLGNHGQIDTFKSSIMKPMRTCEWQNTQGTAPCKGIVIKNECSGDCGLCYGDGNDKNLKSPNAWYFKTISDLYSFPREKDARCPEKGALFTWNNWIPILGENSWARLTGPLQATFLKHGSIVAIPTEDLYMSLDYIPSLTKMLIESVNGIYYAPHNTYGAAKPKGEQVSTENQASTLAGLLMLRSILTTKKIFPNVVKDIDNLATRLETFIKNSYDPELGFFRNGLFYDIKNGNQYSWDTKFAADCQTWTMSVIGSHKVDEWFGKGTALKLWELTKKVAGYKFNGTHAHGIGFDSNFGKPESDQVFSGEWTFGAINMLQIFLNESNGYDKSKLAADIFLMRQGIEAELTSTYNINGVPSASVLYANKRYWIPFGWWSNPIPSTASTGWASLVDNMFNPLYLGGAYKTYVI